MTHPLTLILSDKNKCYKSYYDIWGQVVTYKMSRTQHTKLYIHCVIAKNESKISEDTILPDKLQTIMLQIQYIQKHSKRVNFRKLLGSRLVKKNKNHPYAWYATSSCKPFSLVTGYQIVVELSSCIWTG